MQMSSYSLYARKKSLLRRVYDVVATPVDTDCVDCGSACASTAVRKLTFSSDHPTISNKNTPSLPLAYYRSQPSTEPRSTPTRCCR